MRIKDTCMVHGLAGRVGRGAGGGCEGGKGEGKTEARK